MAENFEEFTLDSLELEGEQDGPKSDVWSDGSRKGKENLIPSCEMRKCGDGAEMQVSVDSAC